MGRMRIDIASPREVPEPLQPGNFAPPPVLLAIVNEHCTVYAPMASFVQLADLEPSSVSSHHYLTIALVYHLISAMLIQHSCS